MESIVLKKAHLQALLQIAATKDIRYYLNGVCLELGLKESRLIATDGHIMGIIRLEDVKSNNVGNYIIPRQAIETFKATSKATTDVELQIESTTLGKLSDGSASYSFSFLDGRFPEYRRVVPKGKMSGEVAQFNPELVTRFAKVAKLFGKKEVILEHNGPTNGLRVFIGEVPDFVGVMMPWRASAPKAPDWVYETVLPSGDE